MSTEHGTAHASNGAGLVCESTENDATYVRHAADLVCFKTSDGTADALICVGVGEPHAMREMPAYKSDLRASTDMCVMRNTLAEDASGIARSLALTNPEILASVSGFGNDMFEVSGSLFHCFGFRD